MGEIPLKKWRNMYMIIAFAFELLTQISFTIAFAAIFFAAAFSAYDSLGDGTPIRTILWTAIAIIFLILLILCWR